MRNKTVFDSRSMPAAVEAEESLIASALLGNSVEIVEFLSASDFYRTDHQIVFRVIEELTTRREPVDMITVSDLLRNSGNLEKVGGAANIVRFPDTVPVAVNIPHYCQIVKQAAQRRAIIQRCNDTARAAFDEPDHNTLMDAVQRAFIDIDCTGPSDTPDSFEYLSYSRPGVWEKLKLKGGMTGIPSGLMAVDRITGGFQKGDLFVLAARPAMGKTAMAGAITEGAVRAGHPVHIFSLEMGSGQWFDRMTAKNALIDLQKFRLGNFSQDEWLKIHAAMSELHSWPIIIDQAHGLTISDIVRRARRRKRELNTRLIIIDYLQLIRGNPNIQRKDLEIAEITRALKTLAVELSLPVILLSQLNRNLEIRPDKRPVLSDLRDSGAIEQDADIVAFIYRDEVYNKKSNDKGIAEINFAKHRNGPEALVKLAWIGWRCAFEDL